MPDREDSPLHWHGRPILTVALAAARYHVGASAVRTAVLRAAERGRPIAPIDPAPIDARTPAWWQDEFDAAWDGRDGRGANLRGHR